jgi:hypothetical protein
MIQEVLPRGKFDDRSLMMKTQHLLVALTVANAGLLIFSLAHPHGTAAQDAPVIRGRALEIVDERGRVRAEIKVSPAQPNLKMPDGTTGYPEAVLLRLFTSKGGPNVKLVTTEDGAGLVLGGERGYTQLLSRSKDPFIKIVTKDGRERAIKP